MKIFIFLLVSPLVICHSTNRFQSSNYKLTSDPGVVRYFDSISGCATHCVSQGKMVRFIPPLRLIILSDLLTQPRPALLIFQSISFMKTVKRLRPNTTSKALLQNTDHLNVLSPKTLGRLNYKFLKSTFQLSFIFQLFKPQGRGL